MKLASLEAIARALGDANVRYLIVGGLAVAAHGYGRVTFDFDVEYDNALAGQILPGLEVRFVRLETLLRMKEMAGREKDLDDVRQLTRWLENREHDP